MVLDGSLRQPVQNGPLPCQEHLEACSYCFVGVLAARNIGIRTSSVIARISRSAIG